MMWGLGRRKKEKGPAEVEDEAVSSEDDELGGNTGGKDMSSRKISLQKASSSSSGNKKKKKKKQPIEDSDEEDKDQDSEMASKKETEVKRKKKSKKEKRQQELKRKEEQEARSKEEASRVLITAKDLKMNVAKEDIESRSIKLAPSQVPEYVSVPIFCEDGPTYVTSIDQASKYNEPVFERPNETDNCQGRVLVPRGGSSRLTMNRRTRWKEEVFLESATNGRFSRVLYDLDDQGKRISMRTFRDKDHISEYSPQKLRMMMNNLEYILEGIFMVSQGLLSGGSLFQLIVVLQISDPYTLLKIYGPLAREVRRMFFFLSVFSFVGVLDKITAERDQKKHWTERGATERAEMFMYGLMFFVCLVFTLLAWPIVDQIDNAFQVSVDDPNFVLASDFQDTLSLWRLYIGFRFGFAALGWILVCKDTNRDLLRGRQRFDEIDQCRSEIEQGKEEVSKLSGKMLDAVTVTELERLSKTLATGLEEVKLQLDIRKKLSIPE